MRNAESMKVNVLEVKCLKCGRRRAGIERALAS